MKKKFYLINCISIVLFLIMLLKTSYASTTGTIYLSSNKQTIVNEEEVEISICIKNAVTSAFTSYLYFDNSKLEYVSGPENTNIIGNRIIYVWYDETGGKVSKDGELAKFKFKAKENGITTFNVEGEFYSNVGQLIQTNFEEIQIQIGDDQNSTEKQIEKKINYIESNNIEAENTNLETLADENTLLYPPFENSITHYDIEVSNEVTNLNILAIPENENGSVEINGKDDLIEGNNLITVTVTAPNGISKKVYEINAYRRNQEEEEKYKKEVEENKEKLENIYQVQRTATETEEKIEESQNKNTYQKIFIVIAIIINLLVLAIFIWKYKS